MSMKRCVKCGRQLRKQRWFDVCRRCRQIEKEKDPDHRRKKVNRITSLLRHHSEPRACILALKQLAIEGWGSLDGLFEDFESLVSCSKFSDAERLSLMQTIIMASASAEIVMATRAENKKNRTLRQLLRQMLKRGSLIPELRKMIRKGEITINDLDPPPAADGCTAARADQRLPVARKIRELRTEKGWSQSYFAKKCGGYQQNQIATIENGERNASPVLLRKIARTCGVSVKELDPRLDDLEPVEPKGPDPEWEWRNEFEHTPFWVEEMTEEELWHYREANHVERLRRACQGRWITPHEIGHLCNLTKKQVWDRLGDIPELQSRRCDKLGRKQFHLPS